MKFSRVGLAISCAFLVCANAVAFSQSPEQSSNDGVRVTVSMHPDGSRTVYKFDGAQHKAVATTTGEDGKLRETIRYELEYRGNEPLVLAASDVSVDYAAWVANSRCRPHAVPCRSEAQISQDVFPAEKFPVPMVASG